MNTQQSLNRVADNYRTQGYVVVLHPGPDDLPNFATDFRVEIVARRADGGVLASAKRDQADLELDRNIPRYAEITGSQMGWRFDIFVLSAENPPQTTRFEAAEPTAAAITLALNEVDQIQVAGFIPQAFITAWSVLETAMRRRLRAEGEEAGWGASPRTLLNELYATGMLQSSELRDLEGMMLVRNAIVHGFASPVIASDSIPFLVELSRRLLEESESIRKTA